MRHSLRGLLLVLVASSACATSESSTDFRDFPPAALTVAVDAPRLVPANDGQDLWFTADAATFRDLLVQGLRGADAASQVVALSELASPEEADLVLTPTIDGAVAMSHEGPTNIWASGGLWLVTWIGGLVTQDSTYNVGLAVDASYEAYPGRKSVAERTVSSPPINTSFFERNDFFSWPTLQALILPPFWTTDQTDKTSRALTEQATREVAERIALFLKQDYERQAFERTLCMVELIAPAQNGAQIVDLSVPLKLRITTREPVRQVSLGVDGAEPLVLLESELKSEEVGMPVRYITDIEKTIPGLTQGRNLVRVRIETAQAFTRTLRLDHTAGR